MGADVVGRDEGLGFEAQVVAEPHDTVGVAVFAEEAVPDLVLDLAHLAENIGVQLLVVRLDVAEVHVADQILHRLKDAVADPADCLHAGRAGRGEILDVGAVHLEKADRDLVPGIALEVGAVLDAALLVRTERAAADEGAGDAELHRGGVVAHRPPEVPVLAEALPAFGHILGKEQVVRAVAGDLLHHLGADQVLVKRNMGDPLVAGGPDHAAVIGGIFLIFENLHLNHPFSACAERILLL